MSREDMLQDVINDKTEALYMVSKSDIVEYYRDTYGKNWTSHAAMALSGTTDKRSHEYKAAIRQFQGNRLHQAGKFLAPKFEAVGQKLPSVGRRLKGDSITVIVSGKQKDRKGGTRERKIEVTLKGDNAQEFISNPDFRDIWDAYDVDPDLFEDGDYAIDVTGVA